MIDDLGIDDALANRRGHRYAEHHERREVEKSGPRDGPLRPQNARRHDGGDGVGGVMEAVHEVERKRDQHQQDEYLETHAARPAAFTRRTPPLMNFRSRCPG